MEFAIGDAYCNPGERLRCVAPFVSTPLESNGSPMYGGAITTRLLNTVPVKQFDLVVYVWCGPAVLVRFCLTRRSIVLYTRHFEVVLGKAARLVRAVTSSLDKAQGVACVSSGTST